MADYTSITLNYNQGTDATPNWTGTAIQFGGTSGANELRFAASGAGTGSTTSANWPYFIRTASVQAVPDLWAFSTDSSGIKVATYDGNRTNSNVLRWNFDATGTPVAAMQFSAFADNTHPTPSPGTQPGTGAGAPIVNGHATDTSSTSYLKANAYGTGFVSSQQTPSAGAAGTTLAATSGTAGAATPSASQWLATWQSLQGWTQYILCGAVFPATTAGFWYWTMALFQGPNLSTGILLPQVTLQYAYT